MSSTASSEAALPPKPTRAPSARPPTLTELAARMSERAPAPLSTTGPSPSASRPRLPAALLARTNSQQGAAPSSATSSVASPDSADVPDSHADTLAEKLSSATLEDEKKPSDGTTSATHERGEKAPRGYKNVPSLNEITERLGIARTRSSDGAAKGTSDMAFPTKATESPDLEDGEIEDTGKKDDEEEKGHPLQHSWQLYHDCKTRGPGAFQQSSGTGEQSPYIHPPNTATGDYEAGLTTIGEFRTVEDFCRYFNWLKPPSQLERNSNYHLFKDGIKPMWEDPANANGGKWVLTMKSNPELLDRCWNWLAMALVGEELDERDEICGAVVSLRAKVDRIQLWLRTKDDIERINSIGKKLVKLLDLQGESGIGLEFQYNTEDRPTHTKFISIVPAQSNSYFRSRGPATGEGDAPPASAPGVGGFGGAGSAFGGGMGNFSTGGGGGWRSRAAGGGGAAAATPLGGAGRTMSAFASHSRSNSAGGSTTAGSGQA